MDPAICQSYGRGGYGREMYDTERQNPAFVVLPSSTREVQKIIKCCIENKMPFVPVSTFYIGFCVPERPNMITIDLKRMDKLEIDSQNMYAMVEPYVTYSQLLSETSPLGLYTNSPLCGSEVSVLANHAGQGFGQLGHRAGFANRKVLGVEWVLPTGKILRLGSAFNTNSNYFWGEGPGPDLRGMMRGWFGHFGGLGVITRMAVKLIPMPSVFPKPFGITPNTGSEYPSEAFRFYNVVYPTMEALVEAMYEVGRSEIGAVCMSIPILWRYIRKAKSRDDFWVNWTADFEKLKKEATKHTLRVAIIGYGSADQTEYERHVLEDIVKETGGEMKQASRYSGSEVFRPATSVEAFLPTGYFISEKLCADSIDHAMKITQSGCELKKSKYTPPFIDDLGCRYINSYDFGHFGYCEVVSFYWKEGIPKASEFELDSIRDDIVHGAYSGAQWTNLHDLIGNGEENYHLLLMKFAKLFDKYGLSNRGLVGARGRLQNQNIVKDIFAKDSEEKGN
jgi:glycolate oxidase